MEVTFYKLQKIVEYNSQLPYSVVKSDDFDYRFITKNGITSASIVSPLSRLSVGCKR